MTNRPNPFKKLRDLAGHRRPPNDAFEPDMGDDEELFGDYVPNYKYDENLKDALSERMREHNLSFPEDPNDERFTDLLAQARNIDRSLATNIQQTRIDIAATRNNPLLKPEQLRARRAASGRELIERIFYVENASGHPTINKGLVGGLLVASAAALFFLLGTPANTEEAATTGDGITVTAADGTTTTTYPDRTVELSTSGIETTTYPDKRVKIVDLKTGVTTVKYPDKVVTVTQKDGSYVKTLADGSVLRYDSTGALAVNLPPGQIDSALNDPNLIQTPNTIPSSPTPPTISGADAGTDSAADPAASNQDTQNTDGVGAIAPPPDGSDFDTEGTLGGADLPGDSGLSAGGATVTSPDANPNDVAGPITPAEDPYTYVPDEEASTVQTTPVQTTPVQTTPVQSSPVQSSPVQTGLSAPSGQAAADPYASLPVESGAGEPSTVVTLPQPQPGAAGAPLGAGPTGSSTPSTVTIRRASALPPPTATNLAGAGAGSGNAVLGGNALPARGGASTGGSTTGGAAANASAGVAAGPMTTTYSSGTDHNVPGGSGAPKASVIGRQAAAPAPNVFRRSAGEGASSAPGASTVIYRRKTSEGADPSGAAGTSGAATGALNTGDEQYAVASDTTGLMASAQGAGAGRSAANTQGAAPTDGPVAQGPASSAPQTPPAGAAPSPYKAGQYLRATLETGMVLPVDAAATPDQGLVVFARTQDGTLWLGTPSISPTRRMTLSFTRAQLRGGAEIAVNAQAYNNDGTPGIKAEFKPEAPSLVDDLIRSTISGVRDYAEAKIQATRTTTGIGGATVVERQVPTIFESVAASAAGVFQLPPTQATFINTARVSKGQSFVIVITPPLRNSVE